MKSKHAYRHPALIHDVGFAVRCHRRICQLKRLTRGINPFHSELNLNLSTSLEASGAAFHAAGTFTSRDMDPLHKGTHKTPRGDTDIGATQSQYISVGCGPVVSSPCSPSGTRHGFASFHSIYTEIFVMMQSLCPREFGKLPRYFAAWK